LTSTKTDFTKTPFDKIHFLESLQSAVGKTFPSPEELHREFIGSETNEIRYFLEDLCRQNKINISAVKTLSKLLDKLFGHFVEPNLIEPTFVLDHPLCMSPLAKEHRSKPGK
jgi:lysyl-tRNA synthetase class 2